jgi:hypothetical protein
MAASAIGELRCTSRVTTTTPVNFSGRSASSASSAASLIGFGFASPTQDTAGPTRSAATATPKSARTNCGNIVSKAERVRASSTSCTLALAADCAIAAPQFAGSVEPASLAARIHNAGLLSLP